MVCVGSGERRYKFKEQQGFRQSLARTTVAIRSSRSAVDKVSAVPNNELTLLGIAFSDMIKPSTDLRYNLAWSYGVFLEDVPRRLGTNAALDASANAVVAAHSSYCSCRGPSPDALRKYSLALSKLKDCLDDVAKARTSETLCAVMLLLICQVSQTSARLLLSS
jgi:hypothetical protein